MKYLLNAICLTSAFTMGYGITVEAFDVPPSEDTAPRGDCIERVADCVPDRACLLRGGACYAWSTSDPIAENANGDDCGCTY